jgi:hypothetical protein
MVLELPYLSHFCVMSSFIDQRRALDDSKHWNCFFGQLEVQMGLNHAIKGGVFRPWSTTIRTEMKKSEHGGFKSQLGPL